MLGGVMVGSATADVKKAATKQAAEEALEKLLLKYPTVEVFRTPAAAAVAANESGVTSGNNDDCSISRKELSSG